MDKGIAKRELCDLDARTQRLKGYSNIPFGAIVDVEYTIYNKFNTRCYLVHYNGHSYYVDIDDISVYIDTKYNTLTS